MMFIFNSQNQKASTPHHKIYFIVKENETERSKEKRKIKPSFLTDYEK